MEIVRNGEPIPNPFVRLKDIGFGNTFRMPRGNSEGTVWIAGKKSQRGTSNSKEIPCISLRAGALSLKDANLEVIPVRGRFVVDDWGEG